jgi:hypothetical protein
MAFISQQLLSYRPFENWQVPPYFSTLLPAAWPLETQPLVARPGYWFACQGPLNASGTRHASLDLFLVGPAAAALADYLAESIRDESIGQVLSTWSTERVVAAQPGLECCLRLHRSILTPDGMLPLTLVKRWVVFTRGDIFITVMLEAVEEDYPRFLEAYNRCLVEWQWLA